MTLTFEEYAAERFTLCRKCVRNVLRAQAGIPIPLPNTRDVVQPFEARKMLDVSGLLRGVTWSEWGVRLYVRNVYSRTVPYTTRGVL